MNDYIGKYIRSYDNFIIRVEEVCNDIVILENGNAHNIKNLIFYCSPLEAIKKGDLVEILYTGNNKYYKLEVIEINDNTLITSHISIAISQLKSFHYDNKLNEIPMIKSIFTLNDDKTIFTLQYNKDEKD